MTDDEICDLIEGALTTLWLTSPEEARDDQSEADAVRPVGATLH